MSQTSTKPNPFARPRPDYPNSQITGAADRVDAVRGFNRAQCEAALQLTALQLTVRRAVMSRLRRLDRAAAQAG